METTLKSNSKRFWSIPKVNSKHRSVPDAVSMTNSDNSGVHAETPIEVVSLFNHYFASVFGPDEGNQLPLASEDKADPETHPDPLLTEVTLSTSEILHNLDPNKATGPDGVTVRILKETAEEIAPSLTELFNKSLRLGLLPNDWKLANIVPVIQEG